MRYGPKPKLEPDQVFEHLLTIADRHGRVKVHHQEIAAHFKVSDDIVWRMVEALRKGQKIRRLREGEKTSQWHVIVGHTAEPEKTGPRKVLWE